MKVAEEIKEKARELLLKGASVKCIELENQPGRFICKAEIPNEDGKTFREGSVLVEILKDEKTGKFKIKALPFGEDGKPNDTLAQYVVLEHLRNMYGAEIEE